MTIGQAKIELRKIQEVPSSWLEQDVLGVVMKQDKNYLLLHDDQKLTNSEKENFEAILIRLKNGEPWAYIIGEVEFYGNNFIINKNVLIPRPETEQIVEEIINIAAKRSMIIDVGCGAGAIILSVLRSRKDMSGIAIDISTDALEVFEKNANSLIGSADSDNIKMLQSNLFEDFDKLSETTDIFEIFTKMGLEIPSEIIIAANLPYVDESWAWINHEKLSYEPEISLFAHDGGLALIKKMLLQIRSINWQNCPVTVLIEHDPIQFDEINKFVVVNFGNKFTLIKNSDYVSRIDMY